MQKVSLYTKYRFLEKEFQTLMKMTGVKTVREAEEYIDKLDEEKRDILFTTIIIFLGNNDKIRSKIFDNNSGV